jgi:hydrogenase maturation protease
MEPKLLVLGIGNPLQGADGFGPAVIERLRTLAPGDGVRLVDAGTDLLGEIDRFAAYDHIVLVDAIVGADPGVQIVEEQTFSGWDDRSPSCHTLSPLLALKLFRQLYPTAQTTIALVALGVDSARFGQTLAAGDVDAGAEAVLMLIEQDS